MNNYDKIIKKRIFSGIQPTGEIHIGNYFGAIKNWINLMDSCECIFCIVDYHAMTTKYDYKTMPFLIYDAAVKNIAAGIDPQKCVLYRQSDVPEHTELAWFLNCLTPLSKLERMTQFKHKSMLHRYNINVGLLNYPVLQAADILLYHSDAVPVGEDQVQHIELCRDIVHYFNKRFGKYFTKPKTLLSDAPRIMGLDAVNKMSKSMNNYISIVEKSDVLWDKISTAVTDPARKRRSDPGTPEICNIFAYHQLVSNKEEVNFVHEGCRTAGIGCVECKKILYNNMEKLISPIRRRANELSSNPDYIFKILEEGSEKCKLIAAKTMSEVRGRIGLSGLKGD